MGADERGSGAETAAYHPTVWRTCRMLANTRRLRCLKAVFEDPACTVGEVAAVTRLPVCRASEYLRALQARGLLQARRDSRWVRYVAAPDPLVEGSRSLVAALKRALLRKRQKESEVRRILTAFTHLRRLAVLRLLLEQGPRCAGDIAAITQISRCALSRHMRKLYLRGLVAYDGEKWRLVQPRDALTKTLLRVIASRRRVAHFAKCAKGDCVAV